MKVKHAVITSVDRDELKDGGSIIWQNTIKAIKTLNSDTTLETLIPDFKAEKENIQRVIDEVPEVVSHNIETVRKIDEASSHTGKILAQHGNFKNFKERKHAHKKWRNAWLR